LAGTVTDAGTVSAALLLESETVLPPLGAASFRVMVQVVAAPALTLAGLQASTVTTAGSTRLRVVVSKVPFRVALMVALWFDERRPAVAMKLAELAPIDIVTDEGTVSSALLLDRVTVVAAEAPWFTVTVQVVEAPEVTVPGLQLEDVKPTGTIAVIVPPVAVVCVALPAAEVPSAFATLIVAPVLAGDNVAVTTATTPFWIKLAFRSPELSPVRKHM
jgi:hypothetical protein